MHTGPQSTKNRSLLRRGRSGGGKVCRELGVNKLLDTNDLVTLRGEREDVYGFAVELMPSREFAIEPRLKRGAEGPSNLSVSMCHVSRTGPTRVL